MRSNKRLPPEDENKTKADACTSHKKERRVKLKRPRLGISLISWTYAVVLHVACFSQSSMSTYE